MKYVKVLKFNEYSVFEVIEEYEKTIKCKLTNCENGYIIIGKNNVVKEADTIEELCDRFVFIDKKYKEGKYRYQVYTRLFEKKNLPKYIQNGTEIYGAIWCEWGLKYVAKLDDKGEWHLL